MDSKHTLTIWIDGEPREATAKITDSGTLVIETDEIRLIEPPRLQKED